ncbi:unnamed protein product [Pichia kudriavzevii]
MTLEKEKILQPREVEDLIANGHAIVVYGDCVLKLDSWMKYHPGGDKAIHHLIGRDATDEMNSYHCDETISIFKRYKIGKLDSPWINMLPPIQGGKYRFLNGEISEKKTMWPNRSYY